MRDILTKNKRPKRKNLQCLQNFLQCLQKFLQALQKLRNAHRDFLLWSNPTKGSATSLRNFFQIINQQMPHFYLLTRKKVRSGVLPPLSHAQTFRNNNGAIRLNSPNSSTLIKILRIGMLTTSSKPP